jgi:DNA-binding NtrC family response regulator
VAGLDLPVVIEGETGVGKERVATALHAWSGRTGPFLAVNCAAIPEALAEAELFGHRRGAFTGADAVRTGHFRSAHQGTLLLDEVHELPATVQAKLLRVVELREVTPLGDSSGIPIDVRVAVTCPGTLSEHVATGAFRADLFARLAGIAVRVPPLRERREDIPGLFMHFASGELGEEALSVGFVEQLINYDYPLNVRELRQLAVRVAALHAGEHLTARHFEQAIQAKRSTRPPPPPAIEVTPELLEQALKVNDGNLAKTAKHLGISRQRAYRMLGDLRTGERAEPRR